MFRPEESASGCKMCKSGAGRSLLGQRGSGSLLCHRHCHRLPHRRHYLQLSQTGGLKIQENDSNIIRNSKRLTRKNRWAQRDISFTARFLPVPIFSWLFVVIYLFCEKGKENARELRTEMDFLSTEGQLTSSAIHTVKNLVFNKTSDFVVGDKEESDTDTF